MSENNYQKQLDESNASIKKIQERRENLKANSKMLKSVNEKYQKVQAETITKMHKKK